MKLKKKLIKKITQINLTYLIYNSSYNIKII